MTDSSIGGARTIATGIRTALGIGGILAVLFGLVIIVWPGHAAEVVTALIAVYAIAGGVVYGALGLFSAGMRGWSRVGHIVLGVLYVVAGIVIFLNLAAATAVLAVFIGVTIGIVWIVEGVVAFSTLDDTASRGWTVFFGVVSILAGVSLLFAPLWGAAVLWWLVGISAVVIGVLQIIRAFAWGRATP